MSLIRLQSSDGDTFEVDTEIAKQSITIKTMLEGRLFGVDLFRLVVLAINIMFDKSLKFIYHFIL